MGTTYAPLLAVGSRLCFFLLQTLFLHLHFVGMTLLLQATLVGCLSLTLAFLLLLPEILSFSAPDTVLIPVYHNKFFQPFAVSILLFSTGYVIVT